MSAISRGAKNAFRNPVRTVSVTAILALSIGLALVMLLAMQAVEARIASVKESIGSAITVNPAGARGFDGGGEPLYQSDVEAVASLANVKSTYAFLSGRLTPDTDTNLQPAIEAGTLGNRQGQRQGGGPTLMINGQAANGGTFKIPITVTGTTDAANKLALGASGTTVTAGSMIDGSSGDNVAMLGKTLAEKNSLAVGSTFTAYEVTFTVSGIFDAGNEFSNNSIYVPLKTLQTLSEQENEVSSITVQASSVDSVDSVAAAIKDKLGTDKADVTTTQDQSADAVAPLENIKSISLYSLIGSLAAGAVITFLIMLMVVRERRKEIGVLKAIGASNFTIVGQFISESFVLTFAGALLGTVLGAALSNPVLSALVSGSESSSTTGAGPTLMGGPAGGGQMVRIGLGGAATAANAAQNALKDLQASVGVDILLYGVLAAFAIAMLGSAIPAWLIAKVRPAEVIRSE